MIFLYGGFPAAGCGHWKALRQGRKVAAGRLRKTGPSLFRRSQIYYALDVYTLGAGFAIGAVLDLKHVGKAFKAKKPSIDAIWPLIRRNFIRGQWFEQLIRGLVGGSKNTQKLTQSVAGIDVNFIPDLLNHSKKVMGEIKEVRKLPRSPQLKAEIAYSGANGYDYALIVSNRNKYISGPLKAQIDNIDGRIFKYDKSGDGSWFRYDFFTKDFVPTTEAVVKAFLKTE